MQQKHPRVPEDQWLKLISIWDNEKHKKRASTNRNNQKNQIMPHCSGRKSFARRRAEEKEKTGIEPTRAQMFIATHKDRKKGKKIDPESVEAVNMMKQKLDEAKSEGRIAWKGDVYDQVINKEERRGQVRGGGLGICPTKLWGRLSSKNPNDDAKCNEVSDERLLQLAEDMKRMEENHAKEMLAMKEQQDEKIKKNVG